jgi:hypothetical protein
MRIYIFDKAVSNQENIKNSSKENFKLFFNSYLLLPAISTGKIFE